MGDDPISTSLWHLSLHVGHRLRHYEALDLLEHCALYFNTDSVILVHRLGLSEPVLGDYVGNFKSEVEVLKNTNASPTAAKKNAKCECSASTARAISSNAPKRSPWDSTAFPHMSPDRTVYHLTTKTGIFGWKFKWFRPFHWNVSGKDGNAQMYSSFPIPTEMTGKFRTINAWTSQRLMKFSLPVGHSCKHLKSTSVRHLNALSEITTRSHH